MWEDPIVAEVHRTREALAEKFNFDVNAIVADIRTRQTALGSRLVSVVQSGEPLHGPASLSKSDTGALPGSM